LPGAIVANRFQYAQRQKDRTFFVHSSMQSSFFQNHNLLANIKYSNNYTLYTDPEYITAEGALVNKYYQDEFYVSVANQFTVNQWLQLALATDFSTETLDANIYRFPYPKRNSYLGVISTSMNWDKLNIQANILAAYIDEKAKTDVPGSNRKLLSPAISASVQPFDIKAFTLRAFYKKSFRMPTFNDLYYTFVGNSNLRPEFTEQYNFGMTWLSDINLGFLRSLSIQTDIYHNKVKNKIIAMPSSNLFRWTIVNLGAVNINGLEVNTNFAFQLPLDISLNTGVAYTFQHAIEDKEQIPYTPLHSGTLTANVRWQAVQLNYSFIYTGERYSQKANIPINYIQPWYTHDLALSWKTTIKRPIKISIEVNNLLNQHYDVILNFPMPGINWRLGLVVSL
jgi:outer membrane receptor protein involved in Fe transport